MTEDSSEPRDPRFASLSRDLRAAQERRDAEVRAAAERLEQAQAARTASAAWRIVIDIVVATAVGGGLGYGLDRLAGTGPWGVIVGLIAGFGAAMWLALRWAQTFQRGAAPPEGKD